MNGRIRWAPCLTTILMLAAPAALAQDPAAVGRGIYNCTFENERMRLCEVTFQPGQKIATHSHPEHLVYVLEPGKMRITDDATGKPEEPDFAKGQAVWMPASRHHGENIGRTRIKALVIELKAPAAGAAADEAPPAPDPDKP